MNERKERLEFLLDKAAAKFKAELAGLYSSLRRGPRAIAAAVDAEWDQLSDSASVFDVDYPSCLESETDAESQPETINTGRTSRSFSVIDSSDEDTVAADSSTEDELPEPAAACRRSATPRPSSSSSSAMAQPHEFGPQPVSSSGTTTTAQHTWPQRSTVQGQRFSDFYRDYVSRIDEAEESAKNEKDVKQRNEEMRRRSRAQLGLPAYDSFDEDLDFSEASASSNAGHRSQLRSQLGIPDYDSFDEDI